MATLTHPDPATPGPWAERGACRGWPTEWWYPGGGIGRGSEPARDVKADEAVARRICEDLCPVRAECLVHALRHREVGIWGATDEDERRRILGKIRRRRGRAA